jgi:hypothetical protein
MQEVTNFTKTVNALLMAQNATYSYPLQLFANFTPITQMGPLSYRAYMRWMF